MFVYSVGFALVIAIVIAICEMFNDDPKPVAVGVSSGIINFIVNMVVIYVVNIILIIGPHENLQI